MFDPKDVQREAKEAAAAAASEAELAEVTVYMRDASGKVIEAETYKRVAACYWQGEMLMLCMAADDDGTLQSRTWPRDVVYEIQMVKRPASRAGATASAQDDQEDQS